ncbi:RNA-directed DNA polymerase, partial [Gregarina niphandrodes]
EALNQNCSYRVADVQPVHLELSREVPRQPIRPLNERLVQVAKEVIPPLLKQRLIEPAAKGTIISPAHFVTKRDGTWRLVIDYRLVNAATVSAHHPLPNIEQILHSLRECKWFSKLDLKNGFWNVPLDESSKNLTGFSVGRLGCYRWNVLPQGHKCAPAEFQQRVEDVLRNLMDAEVVRVYVDDIIIGTKTRDAHLGLVLRVLERLRE